MPPLTHSAAYLSYGSKADMGFGLPYRLSVRGTAGILWGIYAVTGLPLSVFSYSFTGGGLPRPELLDDWSNPILVLIWLFGMLLVFVLPAAALGATAWATVEWVQSRKEDQG